MLLLSSKLIKNLSNQAAKAQAICLCSESSMSSQDVLLLVLNSSTLLNGVYVLTSLGLSGALFSEFVLFRRQEKAYSVKVRVSHSWARNAMALTLTS